MKLEPGEMPSSTWQARLGALKSRAVPDDDPRVIECQAALSYWRCRRVIESEHGALDATWRDALVSQLMEEATPGGNP